MAQQANDACICGHVRRAHEHLRHGTDCSLCEPGACRDFASVTSLRGVLRTKLTGSRLRNSRHDDRQGVDDIGATVVVLRGLQARSG